MIVKPPIKMNCLAGDGRCAVCVIACVCGDLCCRSVEPLLGFAVYPAGLGLLGRTVVVDDDCAVVFTDDIGGFGGWHSFPLAGRCETGYGSKTPVSHPWDNDAGATPYPDPGAHHAAFRSGYRRSISVTSHPVAAAINAALAGETPRPLSSRLTTDRLIPCSIAQGHAFSPFLSRYSRSFFIFLPYCSHW